MNRSNTLQIKQERLWDRHMELAKIGSVGGTGSCRLALSEDDKAARDLFAGWCRKAGLEIRSDRAGNMFALRSGRNPSRGIIAAGSHLDTQPHGGRFDGVSGVLCALEVMETLNDAGIETDATLAIINWTNEEGVRFAPGLQGSSWFTGLIDNDTLDTAEDESGIRFADSLMQTGWRGETRPADLPLEAFLELHIEQGPVLEQAACDVGVVPSVQGMRWLDVTVGGMDAHAGTTPLAERHDALLAAAATLVALHEEGLRTGSEARVSVGRLIPATNGPSTIVGAAQFVIDIRHPDAGMLKALTDRCAEICRSVCAQYRCQATVNERIHIPPVAFDPACIDALQTAADEYGVKSMQLPSGALHDAANIAQLVPTAMLFIPCRNGVSHNINEYASPDHLAAGTNVLLGAMLKLAST